MAAFACLGGDGKGGSQMYQIFLQTQFAFVKAEKTQFIDL